MSVVDEEICCVGSLDEYLDKINNYPNLSIDKMYKLICDYKKNGNIESRDKVIKCNLRLVVLVLNKYHYFSMPIGISILDIIQEGNLALFDAIESFNPNLVSDFPFYASRIIEKYMKKFFVNSCQKFSSSDNAPLDIVKYIIKYGKILDNYPFDVALNQILSVEDIPQCIQDALKVYFTKTISLDELAYDYDKKDSKYMINLYDNLLSDISLDEIAFKNELKEKLRKFLKGIKISDRNIELLILIFEDNGLSQTDIGKKYNMSREAVSHIKMECLKKMKKKGINRLRSYLD